MNTKSLTVVIIFVTLVATTMSIQSVLADSKGQCANCARSLAQGHLNKIDNEGVDQDLTQHGAPPGQVKVDQDLTQHGAPPGQVKVDQDLTQHGAPPGQVKVHCEPCSAKIFAQGQIKKQID
jgi:hypothetical protein